MKFRLPLLLLLIGGFLLACDSHTVEQIEVKVPRGVTVPESMVYIPAGEFIMGHADDPKTAQGKKVSVDAFLIDKYEVSRGQYQKFKPDYEVHPKKVKFPVAHVTYAEAEAYCRWKGGRLPGEAEWEKAARGVDGRKWPWRIFFNHPNNGFSGFLPENVDRRGEWISPYGLYGMGLNVWEWVADWYAYPGQSAANREKFRVIRGGLTQTHTLIRFSPTYFRNWMSPDASFNFIGFRCAESVNQGA